MKLLPVTILILSTLSCQIKHQRIPLYTGMEGKQLAPLHLLLPDSITQINTDSIPRGKPIIMIYFSPYCPFCRAEITDIVKNIRALNGAQIYMLTNFPLRTLKIFDSLFHLDKTPNIITCQDNKQQFEKYYKTPGIPVTAVFDVKKNLKAAYVGFMTAQQITHAAGLD